MASIFGHFTEGEDGVPVLSLYSLPPVEEMVWPEYLYEADEWPDEIPG